MNYWYNTIKMHTPFFISHRTENKTKQRGKELHRQSRAIIIPPPLLFIFKVNDNKSLNCHFSVSTIHKEMKKSCILQNDNHILVLLKNEL